MDAPQEFHYRFPGRVSGQRPGSHSGSSIGAGQEFVTHMSLYDRPDPRRLDLRASLRGFNDDWLVRVNRQRAGAAVRAIVDVSASMTFGGQRPKLHVVADFVEALGLSAFRVGDAVGMMAFDESERADLFMHARVSRGMGSVMGAALRELCDAGGAIGTGVGAGADTAVGTGVGAGAGSAVGTGVGADAGSAVGTGSTQAARCVRGTHGVPGARASRAAHSQRASRAAPGDIGFSDGLEEAASRLAGQQGLVFLVSDFHWPLERLDIVLDLLAHAGVVPVIVWDPAETEPPSHNALASLRDAESGARRTLWLRPRLRQEWRQAVARRRAEIDSFFAAHSIRPFYVEGAFNADALSRYFFEADL